MRSTPRSSWTGSWSRSGFWRTFRDSAVRRAGFVYGVGRGSLGHTSVVSGFDAVDTALHGAGAVSQREAVMDGVVVAAQVSGEGCQRRKAVAFDGLNPGVQQIAT